VTGMQRQAAHRTSLLQRGVMRWIWPPLLGCMLALILFGATLLGLASRASSEEGVASWYGGRHHGRPTASGRPFDQNAMTAAHRTLPLGSRVRVTVLTTGPTFSG